MSSANLSRLETGVTQLTISNESKRNALDWTLCRQMKRAIDQVAADRSIRALVVTGAGREAFCAGADLPDLFGNLPGDVRSIRTYLKEIYDAFLGLRHLQVPVIAAVGGPAVGAGFNVALCSDVVFAAPDAYFDVTFTRLGLHPGGGCTHLLVHAIGRQRAMQIILKGGRIPASTAEQWGLVAQVVDDPLAFAHSLAGHVASLDLELVRNIKASVGLALKDSFEATLEFESWAQASSSNNKTLRAAVDKFR